MPFFVKKICSERANVNNLLIVKNNNKKSKKVLTHNGFYGIIIRLDA